MGELTNVKVSVRNLVEFVLMSGDISSGFVGSSRMVDGAKAHRAVQKSYGSDYTPEMYLSHSLEAGDILLEVRGRADGVIKNEINIIIDEIKSTTRDLADIEEDYNPLHWGQVMVYGYIYCIQNDLEIMDLQLTYYQLETKEMKKFIRTMTLKELEDFFNHLVVNYIKWARLIRDWNIKRDISIKQVQFPFGNYRPGQRHLAVCAYKCSRDGGKVFAKAPTGIGKTMATMFPSLKSMGEGYTSKVFYLTAKTITSSVAQGALEKLRQGGLNLKSVALTAKEKSCINEEFSCDPEKCIFAKGYYDRLKDGLEDIFINEDDYTRQVIEEYARKHDLCPFEFSLDISNWCDLIICDYNYAFDPRVYLKRFFEEGPGDYTFLVDEAHNLVDRSREMFSAQLLKSSVLNLKKKLEKDAQGIKRIINKINKFMIESKKQCEEGHLVDKEPPLELYPLLRSFITSGEKFLIENKNHPQREDVLQMYFDVLSFLRTSEYYDENYVTYYHTEDNDFCVKLFCINPSVLLKEAMTRAKAVVVFSATLSPMEYFVDILGGDEDSIRVALQSPFDKDNLCIMVADGISTRYKKRQDTYDDVASMIAAAAKGKQGNYLVYFPSYQYMNEVYTRFCEHEEDIDTIVQTSSMTEEQREEFLNSFNLENDKTLVGFAVMGGIFGEGIDLTGDRLVGAIIVGVGLPKICTERDIIRNHFDNTKKSGFEYAYVYPGMNKVMQAVGRVIRTEEDRGVVLLIDDRFSSYQYKSLFPPEWYHAKRVRDKQQLDNYIKDFWGK